MAAVREVAADVGGGAAVAVTAAAAAAVAVLAAAVAAPTPAAAALSASAFLDSLPSPPRSRGDTHGGPGAALAAAPRRGGSTTPAGRPAGVIVLHGSGSSGEQTLGILHAVLLLAPRLPTYTHFVAPTAVRVDGTEGSWFASSRNASAPGGRTFDAATLDAAAARVEAIVANEVARGVPRSRLALVGFSQGGALALEVTRRLAAGSAGGGGGGGPLAGIVIGAGFVAGPGRWAGLSNARGEVLMVHGGRDTVVPLAAARQSAAVVRRAGYAVTLEVLPEEGHLITSPAAVGQALSFLTRVLPP